MKNSIKEWEILNSTITCVYFLKEGIDYWYVFLRISFLQNIIFMSTRKPAVKTTSFTGEENEKPKSQRGFTLPLTGSLDWISELRHSLASMVFQ